MDAGAPRSPTSSLGATPGAASSPGLEELLQVAQQSRPLGDLQGALEALKRAEMINPESPVMLHEMALCYEQMGLTDKAMAVWRRLEALGPQRAGDFHRVAAQRLGGLAGGAPSLEPAAVMPSPPGSEPRSFNPIAPEPAAPPNDPGRQMRLGPCQIIRDPTVTRGEKLTLRVPIEAVSKTQPVDPSAIDIDVFFFDRVNGQKVEQSIANEPVSTWVEPPVNWADNGREYLDVSYFLPELSPDEIKNHGHRAFHGYVVKLYYQHRLQDAAAEPRDLLDYGAHPAGTPGAPQNALLPPVGN